MGLCNACPSAPPRPAGTPPHIWCAPRGGGGGAVADTPPPTTVAGGGGGIRASPSALRDMLGLPLGVFGGVGAWESSPLQAPGSQRGRGQQGITLLGPFVRSVHDGDGMAMSEMRATMAILVDTRAMEVRCHRGKGCHQGNKPSLPLCGGGGGGGTTVDEAQSGMHKKGRDLRGGPRSGYAVGGGCPSGWGRLLSVTHAIEAGTLRQGDSGWV